MSDPDATATVPGVVPDAEVPVEVVGRSQVKANALLLRKAFASRFSDCTKAPSDTDDLVKNASQYSGRYALEAGFRRCASRLGASNMRAPRFEFDAP